VPNTAKKRNPRLVPKPERDAAIRPDDEIEREIAKREARLRELFPGVPERAHRLGRVLDNLTSPILSYLLSAEEPDRSQMRRAVALEIVLFSTFMGRPTKPPRLWSERDVDEPTNPVEFIRKHYKRWVGFGLTRKDLRDLDPQLYHALSVWEHRHPDDRMVELPTLSEVIDQKVAALRAEFSEDELRKLGTTLQTRLRRMKK
jgi:hypothetical protein